MTYARPGRRHALRASSGPYTMRRQADEDNRKTADCQSSEVSDTELYQDPVFTFRKLGRTLAASCHKLTNDQKAQHLSAGPALSSKRRRTPYTRFSRTGSWTSSMSAGPSAPVKLEKSSTTKQILNDRKLAGHLQALEDEILVIDNEMQALNDDDAMQDISLPSSSRICPSLTQDYPVKPKDLQRFLGGSSSHESSGPGDHPLADKDLMQDVAMPSSPRIIPSPSQDYRATAEDLQRLMNESCGRKNSKFGKSIFGRGFDKGRRSLQSRHQDSGDEEDVDIQKRRKRYAIYGMNQLLASEASQNARYCSSRPTRRVSKGTRSSLVPAFSGSAISRLGGRGTQDDPIELSSDSEGEDKDVDMFYDAPAEQDPPVLMHDCAVCGDSKHIADMPSLASCTHQASTCALCFARCIESELTSKGWKGMTCPDADCDVVLAHHEVQRYATPEVFAQYDMFAMRDALGQVPSFRWCRNLTCGSGQEHYEDGYIFKCVACGHKTCTIHNVDWHEGETCDEYTYRVSGARERELKAQEEATIAAINKLSKKCPGPACAFNIQKNNGCDHMTCSQCRYEFCWECLADYNKIRIKGNAAHAKGCKYHSSRIR